MKITKRQLRKIIRESLDDAFSQWGPTTDDIDEWWEYMDPGSVRKLSKDLRVNPDNSKWNAREWESVMNYYAQIEMGDPRGYHRSRNI